MKLALASCLLSSTALAQAVVVEPAVLILDDGASARVRVEPARGAPRWITTLGRIDGGTFVPGDRRAAGFALIVDAEAPAATVIALVGKGELPTETAPGAAVTVDIAGRSFGPVTADRKGHADVPVEVPPGVALATVSSRYPDGRTTVRQVPLPTRDFPLAVLIAPDRLVEGDEKTATIFTIGVDGKWRAPASAPVIETDAALRAGPPRAAGPGRWDVPLVAAAPATAASLRVLIDGAPAASQTIEVTARPRPRVVIPPRPEPPEPSALAVYAGGASAFGPLASIVVGAEYLRPLRRKGIRIALLAALSGGYGAVDTFRGAPVQADLTQLHLGVGARLRFALGARSGLEASAGAGACWARSAISGADAETALAPLFYGGLAFVYALASAELVVDGRWTELRLDETTRIEGNALGATLLFGYRFRL
jgi:hypothetical protein